MKLLLEPKTTQKELEEMVCCADCGRKIPQNTAYKTRTGYYLCPGETSVCIAQYLDNQDIFLLEPIKI